MRAKRLACALVILFSLVLLAALLFPQAMPVNPGVITACLLKPVIACSVLSAQCSVLSAQSAVLGSRFSVLLRHLRFEASQFLTGLGEFAAHPHALEEVDGFGEGSVGGGEIAV